MGRREQLEAELVLVAAEERWAQAKEARRDKETPATLKEYREANEALGAARDAHRARRDELNPGPGGAVAKPKSTSAKGSAGRAKAKGGS